MRTNLLKLNDDKTEFVLVSTRNKLAKITPNIKIQIGDDIIGPTDTVRNLGYLWNHYMKDNHHENKLSSLLFPTLRNISRIFDLLDTETTKILIQALVTSRTDYCNSLLPGASKYNLDKLQ